ncbi:MAG TPA: BatA and WFA domain-containing protein [Pirellulaceae bacterium]|nr:BatA and WFA domain-containing protein [Pirellulaceae bacterium]
MTWLNTLSAGAWAVLLAVPPLIVLLYFLKLKRQPLSVPSTLLWARTLEDMHVNSLWQRLRSSILLILQLLMIMAVMAAALRPGCHRDELVGERFIFLLDNSASMSATDVGNGDRLEEAKRQIRATVDSMAPDHAGMLIAFSDRAEVVQSYTKDKELLKRQVDSVVIWEHSTDMSEALTAASGLTNPGRIVHEDDDGPVAESQPARLMIFSDGRARINPDIDFGNLSVEYFPIGTMAPHNVGIVGFAIHDERINEGKLEAYVQLQNSNDSDRTVGISLYVNDILFDAEGGVPLQRNAATSVRFNLGSLIPAMNEPLKIYVQIDDPDDFMIDNEVFAVLNPPQPNKILVITPGNPYLRVALNTDSVQSVARVTYRNRDYLQDPDYMEQVMLGRFDLVVFDQCQPSIMPPCNTVLIGRIPPGDAWTIGERNFPTLLIDYDQSHPLLETTQFSRVTIVEGAALSGPPGTKPLVEADYGTIVAIGPRGGYQDLVLSFPLIEMDDQGKLSVNTNWPSQLSFPLFIQNVVRVLGGGSRQIGSHDIRTGQIASLRRSPQVEQIRVQSPDNRLFTLRRARDGEFIFGHTDRRGFYTVTDLVPPGETIPFAVNLLDAQESNLAVNDSLDIGGEQIAASAARETVWLELWKWLVLAALVVLFVEWIIYNRRILI